MLGVTGGIAAYKAIDVCRQLVDAGAHVIPVLTDDAQRFVGALTFSALASEPARTSMFEGPDPIPHTQLGRRADLVVVAPATAKVIGKYTHGISDDLLTATLLATKAPDEVGAYRELVLGAAAAGGADFAAVDLSPLPSGEG